jgi:uncharacterized membrane protein
VHFEESVELAAKVIDAVGVTVIVGGIALATTLIARSGAAWDQRFRDYRRGVGRSILLGLEFLVAADIIRTVAVSPTFYGVGVLGIIVLIRTFLSFTLELEIDGRWPWQRQTAGRANDGNSQLVSVRELKPSDVAYVDRFLPLSRFTEETGEAGTASTYLVAWDGRDPVGHTHIAWTGTHLAIPEIQDVFVLPERRRQGIASQLTQAADHTSVAAGRRAG